MEYEVENSSKDAITVYIQGDITFTETTKFKQLLEALSKTEMAKCVFDLTKVGIVDSAGLGMFLVANEQANNAKFKLNVIGASAPIISMLRLTKLSKLFE